MDTYTMRGSSNLRPMSRRSFLRAAGTVGGLASLGVLSACSREGSGGGAVVLKVGPEGTFAAMPSKAEQKGNVTLQAYADALQKWYDANPGVELRKTSIDIWDQEAMVTAVAGGTAPAIYPSNPLGDWSQPEINSAFRQGLAADVTDRIDSSGLVAKLSDFVRPAWESAWKVGGKYYGVPGGYSVGDGIFYRRDLFAEADLAEPTPEWTWADVHRMARALTVKDRKGIAEPAWALSMRFTSAGSGLLTELPAPDTKWHWTSDYTSMADTWVAIIEDFRRLMFEDRSIVSDISYNSWNEVSAAFLRDDVAMRPGNSTSYFDSPDSDTSFASLARRLDKPVGDVVGWMSYPLGEQGQFPGRRSFITAYSFNPDLDAEALDACFSLYSFMIGPGLVQQANAVYEKTKDLRQVYDAGTLTPILADTRSKLPGSPEEAWGKQFVDAVLRAGSRMVVPERSSYLPPEEKAGPSSKASEDAFSRWMYERGSIDLRADLRRLEETLNKQAESFSSSVGKEEFVTGAKKYFAAHDAFWKEDAPEFHEQIFRPWYEDRVLPALGA